MNIVANREVSVPATKSLGGKVKDMFSRKAKAATVYDLKIIFHRACAGELTHGSIVVSNKSEKLNNQPVRFAFVGIPHAPLLTPDVIYHIWREAERQGYVAHTLMSYNALS